MEFQRIVSTLTLNGTRALLALDEDLATGDDFRCGFRAPDLHASIIFGTATTRAARVG